MMRTLPRVSATRRTTLTSTTSVIICSGARCRGSLASGVCILRAVHTAAVWGLHITMNGRHDVRVVCRHLLWRFQPGGGDMRAHHLTHSHIPRLDHPLLVASCVSSSDPCTSSTTIPRRCGAEPPQTRDTRRRRHLAPRHAQTRPTQGTRGANKKPQHSDHRRRPSTSCLSTSKESKSHTQRGSRGILGRYVYRSDCASDKATLTHPEPARPQPPGPHIHVRRLPARLARVVRGPGRLAHAAVGRVGRVLLGCALQTVGRPAGTG